MLSLDFFEGVHATLRAVLATLCEPLMHPNQVREIRPGGVVRETIDYPAGFFFHVRLSHVGIIPNREDATGALFQRGWPHRPLYLVPDRHHRRHVGGRDERRER